MNKAQIKQVFRLLATAIPEPKTELNHNSPFELLVAVILSAQATDVSVNQATAKLFAVANTPQQILELGISGLKKFIKHIGLHNTKAANILKTCKILLEQHAAQVPNNREALEKLPGVGRKTANVILNTGFGQPTIAVDTHVFRVANRISLAKGKTPQQIEAQLTKIVPPAFAHDAHHLLILHGRYTCTAKKPKCQQCSIKQLCKFYASEVS